MGYCSQCGSFLEEDARYCSECESQVVAKPKPPRLPNTQPPQPGPRSAVGDVADGIRRHPFRFAAAVILVFVIVTRSYKVNAQHSHTLRVVGTLIGNASPVTGNHVWCEWSNHMPPTKQQHMSNLQGNRDHLEMHLMLHNTASYKVTVSVTPTYYIGTQSHGDSKLNRHLRSIPAHGTFSWYLNAGTPPGGEAPISKCAPSIRLAG